MSRLILPFLLLALLPALPSQAATVVGSFSGLSDSQYSDIWKVANASPQPLIMDDLSGDDDLRGLYVGAISEVGCQLFVTSEWGESVLALDFVSTGTIATINDIPVGVVEIDLSPLRCLVAYNFQSFGPIGETPADTEEEPAEEQEEEQEEETTCSDTDGGFDGYVTGTMTHNFPGIPSPVTDTCVAGVNIQEYYCDASLYDGSHFTQTNCPNGCSQGRCLTDEEVAVMGPGTGEDTPPQVAFISCEDSDFGAAPHTPGTLTLVAQETEITTEGQVVEQSDECFSESQLVELYCDVNAANQFGYTFIDCPGGCQNGACVTSVCEETDDGFDTTTAGTMTHDLALLPAPARDVCTSPTKLREYACGYNLDDPSPDNDYTGTATCAYGCVTNNAGEGRCLRFIETLNPLNAFQMLSIWLSWLLSLFGN